MWYWHVEDMLQIWYKHGAEMLETYNRHVRDMFIDMLKTCYKQVTDMNVC